MDKHTTNKSMLGVQYIVFSFSIFLFVWFMVSCFDVACNNLSPRKQGEVRTKSWNLIVKIVEYAHNKGLKGAENYRRP
ncbi:MAG: hypothetical protein QXD03_02450 [Candidatus Anstonellales archaeon]